MYISWTQVVDLYVQSIVQQQIRVTKQIQNKLINCQLNLSMTSGEQLSSCIEHLGYPKINQYML